MRKEKDSLGWINIPDEKLWGAVTQRSLQNFKIGNNLMPFEIIESLAIIKKSAARINEKEGLISKAKSTIIQQVCDEILENKLNEHFPLSIWQTGSGTHTNMNINEVISNRGIQISINQYNDSQIKLHPNDDVNKSQSSNDVFPSAIHLALLKLIFKETLPALQALRDAFLLKQNEFQSIIKTGRTHMMDAVPMSLGDEFGAFAEQINWGIKAISNSIIHLRELPIGGTAIGTGINAPKDFSPQMCNLINQLTGLEVKPASNRFESMSSRSAIVEIQNAMSQTAVDLFKITNDIRTMSSGPRTGIGELILPAMEPGSSIMPGKINPTQIEAAQMACTRIISHQTGINISNLSGQFQINTFMPLIAANSLESAKLLADISNSFRMNTLFELKANKAQIEIHLNRSLMLITALVPKIGYDNAAKIAQNAMEQNISLRKAAINSGFISDKEFDKIVKPEDML
jgi:fumarate hydratase, class II